MEAEIGSAVYPSIIMDKPNEPLLMHEGEFILRGDDFSIAVKGKIELRWFPLTSVYFEAVSIQPSDAQIKMLHSKLPCIIEIENLPLGYFLITTMAVDGSKIEGVSSGSTKLGDTSIKISSVKFSIVNMRKFIGAPVQHKNGSIGRDRIYMKYKDFSITIDHLPNEKDSQGKPKSVQEKLKTHGGYIVTHGGILEKVDSSPFSLEDSIKILRRLLWHLNFINERQVGIVFWKGIFKDEEKWQFTGFTIPSIFVKGPTWAPPNNKPEWHLNLFNSFCKKFDSGYKDSLITLTTWLNQININNGYTNTKMITCQAALELCYQILVIERHSLIDGPDQDNISASNKIRLLLHLMNISKKCPSDYKELSNFIKNEHIILDSPAAITYLRNNITHSNTEKISNLEKLDNKENLRYQILSIGHKYLELSILFLLNYKGKYLNRLSGSKHFNESIEKVPWNSKSTINLSTI